MSDRGKKIFLAICIITPLILYSVYYYSIMVKNAPYKFTEFESITLKYGLGDSLVNQYNSKTGLYQYVNERDSLITTTVRLKKDDLLYLHRKASELGFWNFPEEILGSAKGEKALNIPRYYIEYKYKQKNKKVIFDYRYSGDPKLLDAAKQLAKEISGRISDAEDRAN